MNSIQFDEKYTPDYLMKKGASLANILRDKIEDNTDRIELALIASILTLRTGIDKLKHLQLERMNQEKQAEGKL